MWGLPQMTAVPESDVNCGVQAWLLHSAVEASGMSSFPTPPLSSPVQNSANKVYFRSCCECLVRQCEGTLHCNNLHQSWSLGGAG